MTTKTKTVVRTYVYLSNGLAKAKKLRRPPPPMVTVLYESDANEYAHDYRRCYNQALRKYRGKQRRKCMRLRAKLEVTAPAFKTTVQRWLDAEMAKLEPLEAGIITADMFAEYKPEWA